MASGRRLFGSVPVAYVFLDKSDEGSVTPMLPLLQGNPGAWKLVYADEKDRFASMRSTSRGGGQGSTESAIEPWFTRIRRARRERRTDRSDPTACP
jgi:hypothetical protein